MKIDLQTSYAMDDSCQMQFFSKGHHVWGSFIEAVRVELAENGRDDIPWWAVVQAPVKQVYRRTVPCRSSIVSDIQYIDQDKPGRGASPITFMDFWFPIHRSAAPAGLGEVKAVAPIGYIDSNAIEFLRNRNLIFATIHRDKSEECACGVYAAPVAQALPVVAEPQDKAILDWLESKCVNVRQNLRYGSRDMFWSNPEDLDGGPAGPSELRKQCIAAMQGEKA